MSVTKKCTQLQYTFHIMMAILSIRFDVNHLSSPRLLCVEALAHRDMIMCILLRRPVNNESFHCCND